jgi:tetratricopeptide (TPR) repeat protein
MDARQKLTLEAAAGLAVWFGAVLACLWWSRPLFWVNAYAEFDEARALASQGRFVEAVRSVDRRWTGARAPVGSNPGYMVFRAYRWLDLAQPAGAEEAFRDVLRTDPSNVEAALGLATALIQQNQHAAAQLTLMSLGPRTISPAELRRRSQLFISIGARELALNDLRRLLENQPSDPELLKEAVVLARGERRWDETASLAARLASVTRDPELRTWASDTRGEALEFEGKFAQALDAYRDGADPNRLEGRATLARRLGRHDDEARLYAQLAAIHPDEPRFRRSEAFALLAAGRLGEAERAFGSLVADDRADIGARTAYAWLLNAQHRYADAWQVLESLPRPSEDLAILDLQTRTALWAGRPEAAAPLVRALVELRREAAELWRQLANTWATVGDEGRAAEAFVEYLRLQPGDVPARRRLAQILSQTGSIDAALDEYRRVAEAEPYNAQYLADLGVLQETAGDLEGAKASYRLAVERAEHPDAEIYLRLGRLYRWTSRPRDALAWYEKYIRGDGEATRIREAESELALGLLEAADPAGSLSRLEATESVRALDEEELLTAARAATETANRPRAAAYLERLSKRRTLTTDERTWLADMYRGAAQPARALALYEELFVERGADARMLETLGDLRYDLGDFDGALGAFQSIGTPAVSLKVARSADRAGRHSVAAGAYQQYVREHPEDVERQLEAARYFAGTGRASDAVTYYRSVVARRGSVDLRLELARIHLAAGSFDEAARWAREAVDAGESPNESRLALAEGLFLQGALREADAVLASLTSAGSAPVDAFVWRGEIAAALDRHLSAYRLWERALAAGAAGRAALLVRMGRSARERGDFGHAEQAIARASRESAVAAEFAPEVAAARTELDAATATRILVPAWVQTDTNDLRLDGQGGGMRLRAPARAATMSLVASTGTISQRAFSSRRTGVDLDVAGVFPAPGLEMSFGTAIDTFERASTLMTWRAAATHHREDTSTLGVSLSREPLLPMRGATDLRQFQPGALDIAALGPGFHLHSVQAFGQQALGGDRRLRLAAGLDWLADGNERRSLSLHYQVPVVRSVRRWLAIRPNVFAESYADVRPLYFSPSRHTTVGVTVHGIFRGERWYLELESNPQWLRARGINAFGTHSLMRGGLTRGDVSVSAGAFLFHDGANGYVQRRLGAEIGIPVRR